MPRTVNDIEAGANDIFEPLPIEIWFIIFEYLDFISLYRARAVNSSLKQLSDETIARHVRDLDILVAFLQKIDEYLCAKNPKFKAILAKAKKYSLTEYAMDHIYPSLLDPNALPIDHARARALYSFITPQLNLPSHPTPLLKQHSLLWLVLLPCTILGLTLYAIDNVTYSKQTDSTNSKANSTIAYILLLISALLVITNSLKYKRDISLFKNSIHNFIEAHTQPFNEFMQFDQIHLSKKQKRCLISGLLAKQGLYRLSRNPTHQMQQVDQASYELVVNQVHNENTLISNLRLNK